MTLDELLALPPWSVDQAVKEDALLSSLNELTALHRSRCP